MLRRSNPFPAWLGRQRAGAPTRAGLAGMDPAATDRVRRGGPDGPEWLLEIKFCEAPI